jgi:hypothetical protein
MRKCDDGSFCYGVDNLACCAQGQGVFLLNGEQVAVNPNATTTSSSSVTSTPTSTSAISSTFSTSPIPTHSSTGGLSTGAKAGIGVSAALGALLIIALVCWLTWRRTRKSRMDHTSKGEIQNPWPMEQTPQQPVHPPLHELPSPPTASRSGLSEMEGSPQWSGSGEDPLKKKGTPVGRFA